MVYFSRSKLNLVKR